MICQDPPLINIFVYGERPGQQAMAVPVSALTIILIGVFAAALAIGLLFLVRTRRHAHQTAVEKEPRGREVNFFFSGLIFLYKRAFSYSVQPAELTAATIVSQEPVTGISTPPPPEPVIQPTVSIPLPGPTLPEQPAPAAFPIPPTSHTQPAGRAYGLQSMIDTMGEGIERALSGMTNGIFFIFDGLINLFKWILRIDR